VTEFFDYRVAAKASGLMLGQHKSYQRGSGADFYKTSRFLDEPDPRRLDLRMSLSDPFETLYVKSFRQRSKLDVWVFIDASSSMFFDHKKALIAALYNSIRHSVERAGDRFSSFLIAETVQGINDHDSITELLNTQQMHGQGVEATQQIYRILPNKPALIFIISDFYWPATQFDSLMTVLSKHWVVPTVLWQSKEYLDFPLWRFVELTDLETGERGLVFVTRQQKRRLAEQYQAAKQGLAHKFRRFQQRPFWLIDDYNVRDMSRYFAAS
jgi:uncharacterized protein (DUF58 family)